MGGYLNPFRIAGDVSHALSKLILMVAIHRNRSAEGVSWITQVLYVVVFFTRYTDIWIPEEHRSSSFLKTWNWLFKIYYMISSLYIVGIMRWLFPRTREREVAWKLGAIIFFGTLIISPFVFWIFPTNFEKTFSAWLWNWSQILESVCVLPQLLLLRQTTVPTVIDSFYLVTLGSYRALYIPNWIWRWAKSGKGGDHGPEVVSVVFGIIQTALYVDFAWVYWTRQRVKLRNGGIVDADDMGRGWLVNRLLGRQDDRAPGDEERAPALGGRPRPRSKWGARGISVSADDGILDGQEEGLVEGPVDPDATMRDPEELARALQDSSDEEEEDDDEEEDDSEDGSAGPKKQTAGTASGVTNGSEWRS